MSLDSWAFKGTALDFSGKVSVLDITGLGALAQWKGSDIPLAGLPGRRWSKKLPDARTVGLALQLIDTPTAMLSAGSVIDSLDQLFASEVQGALAHTLADASVRTAQAQVAQWSPKPDGMTGSRFLGTVDFELADPLFYGASGTTSHATAASPTDFSATNAGTKANYKLVLTFHGPMSSPRLTNLTNGWYVEVDVTVASGQSLVVDCGAFTALNNGVSCIGSVVHSGGTPFLRLEPGVNNLEYTATTPGGSVDVVFAPTY